MSESEPAAPRRLAEAVLLFGAYSLLAEASYLFVFPPSTNAIFWLPSGLTFALFLRTSRRRWPEWLVVMFVAEVVTVLAHRESLPIALGWATAGCLFPPTAAALLCAVTTTPFSLRDVRCVVLLVAAVAIGAVPGAVVAAATAAAGQDVPFGSTLASWWSSDCLGTLLGAPVVLTLLEHEPRPPGRAIEAGVSAALVIGVGNGVFGAQDPGDLVVSLPYLMLPAVAWVSVRFGKRGAAMTTAVLDLLAVWHTTRGRGPFAAINGPPVSLINVQIYVAVLGIFALMLATADVHERQVRASAQAAERQSRFLAEATTLIWESLDYTERLNRLTQLCVRWLADWCVIDLLEDDGRIRRIGGAHADPRKQPLLEELRRRWEPTPNSPQPNARVLRDRRALLIRDQTTVLDRYSIDEDHRRILRELGAASVIAVPLVVRGLPLGALCVVRADRSRPYGPTDLALVQELSRRAAVAVDNARLYRDTQHAVHLRDEFLSVASHELNTPITSVLLALDVIERSPPGSPQSRRMLTVVARQTRRLARLVDELLAVSRIVSGRLHLEPEELELGEVVRDVAAGMQQNLSRAGCPLFIAAPELVSGRWDRLRLEQLVTNLLSNAMKFGAGEPIEIEVGRTTRNATLTVRDHGIGIPADRTKAIFERFERAVSARATAGSAWASTSPARSSKRTAAPSALTPPPGAARASPSSSPSPCLQR